MVHELSSPRPPQTRVHCSQMSGRAGVEQALDPVTQPRVGDRWENGVPGSQPGGVAPQGRGYLCFLSEPSKGTAV